MDPDTGTRETAMGASSTPGPGSPARRGRVALVTAKGDAGADHDEDLPLITDSLTEVGIHVETVAWDDADVRWDDFDIAIIRSTWDYCDRVDEFRSWAVRTGQRSRLYNSADVVAWNSEKTYLRDLDRAGVRIVPTRFYEPGTEFIEPAGDYVVKPAVGAGAKDAARYGAGEPGDPVAHVRSLHDRGSAVLVQPYLRSVDEHGERALVLIRGRFSHAMKKGPVLTSGSGIDDRRQAHPDIARYEPDRSEVELAEHAISVAPASAGSLLYARADVVTGEDGEPCVMELELIEPNLFFKHEPKALGGFATAVTSLVR